MEEEKEKEEEKRQKIRIRIKRKPLNTDLIKKYLSKKKGCNCGKKTDT